MKTSPTAHNMECPTVHGEHWNQVALISMTISQINVDQDRSNHCLSTHSKDSPHQKVYIYVFSKYSVGDVGNVCTKKEVFSV